MALKKKIILGLSAASLLSIGFIVFMSYKTQKTSINPPISSTSPSYKNLQPGVSTTKDITNNLGDPAKETQDGIYNILEYSSNNPNFNNQLYVNSDKLTLVKQIVAPNDNIKIQDLTQKYGNYENMLYASGSASGFNLYVYPSKGIAYVGHQESGIVLEVWYFTPTTFDNFKATFAKDYSDNPVPGQ